MRIFQQATLSGSVNGMADLQRIESLQIRHLSQQQQQPAAHTDTLTSRMRLPLSGSAKMPETGLGVKGLRYYLSLSRRSRRLYH